MSRVQIDPEVATVLVRGSQEGLVFRLPDEPLDRKLYVKVDKILKALGSKWSRSDKGHRVPESFAGRLADALDTGCAVDRDKALGFFSSPLDVADQVFALAAIGPEHTVLEPSAGTGALVRPELGQSWVLVEIDPERGRQLSDRFPAHLVTVANFLDLRRGLDLGSFDRVIMNPPFGLKPRAVDHVLHALSLLTPDGVLVAILPQGVEFREDRATVAFHAAVAAQGGVFHALPEGAFKASGTSVRTCLLVVDRRAS